MKTVFLIGTGGFLGAISRYLLASGIEKIFYSFQGIGILGANLLGSFLMGCLYFFSVKFLDLSEELKFFLGVGFLGAFTTYSSYAQISFNYIQKGNWGMGGFYILSNSLGTIIILALAWWVCSLVFKI